MSSRSVIASESDAIQLVVQEEAGLPRRFAPRNDGVGIWSLSPVSSWIASRSLFKTIHRIVLPPAADTPHLAMTGDVIASGSDAIQLVIGGGVAGVGEKWLALAGSLHVRSR